MTERKIFGIVVRVLGLWYILLSVEWLMAPVINALKQPEQTQDIFPPGIKSPPAPQTISHTASWLVSGGWRLLLGLLLFFLANQIVRLAYRKSSDNSD